MKAYTFKYRYCPKPMHIPRRDLETGKLDILTVGSCNDFLNCRQCADKIRRKNWVKTRKKIDELKNGLTKGERLQFLTLPMSIVGLSLEEGLAKFNKALDNLRRRTWWKKRVSGYVGSKEFSRKGIHIHLVISAKFIREEELMAIWEQLTGCSEINLQQVGKTKEDLEKIASYICKGISGELKEEFSELRKKKKMRLMVSSLRKRTILDSIAITQHGLDLQVKQKYVYFSPYKRKMDAIKAIDYIKKYLSLKRVLKEV